MSNLTPITAEEAAEMLRAAAFPVTNPEDSSHGRTLIHCFLGMMGADWDLESALDLLSTAQAVGWIDSIFQHDLAIVGEDDRVYTFAVKRPAPKEPEAVATPEVVPTTTAEERSAKALGIAMQYAGIDGDHHKAWVLDQMVRALTDCPVITKTADDYRGRSYSYQAQGESPEYQAWVAAYQDGEDGPETYKWDEGIAP